LKRAIAYGIVERELWAEEESFDGLKNGFPKREAIHKMGWR